MSKKINPSVVGAFVIGATALAVAAIVAFGKGAFMERRYKYELSFTESIDGLSVGAPVDFMGVRVGSVVDINLIIDDSREGAVLRPVTIALEEHRTSFIDDLNSQTRVDEWIAMLVERHGLRAQLATENILTGKLKVQLALHPGTKGHQENLSIEHPEIPTIPSTQESIKKTIEQIPFDAIMADIGETAKGISKIVNNPDAAAALTNLNAALIRLNATLGSIEGFVGSAGDLLEDVARDVKPVLRQANASMANVDAAVTNAAVLIATLEAETGPLIESVTELSEKLNTMVDEQSNLRVAALECMNEMRRALRSLANLTEYLQRHPESLLRGKK